MHVARPKWVPRSDEQREAIAAVVEAVAAVSAATATLKSAVEAADALEVPRSHLAEAAGKSRSTFYRELRAAARAEPDQQ